MKNQKFLVWLLMSFSYFYGEKITFSQTNFWNLLTGPDNLLIDCRPIPPLPHHPKVEEISDYVDRLSQIYKVPSVIIKAMIEIESCWRQFLDDGSPNISGDGGIGLTQLTPSKIFNPPGSNIALLGKITEPPQTGCQPGFESVNEFSTTTEPVEVDIEKLKWDWKYNLEVGVRWLVAQKVFSGGECDDARILENWYYPLAYYNGATKGGQNDPISPIYSRKVSINDPNDYWKDKSIFPYQECVYNIIAQLYLIPDDRKSYLYSDGNHLTVESPLVG